MKSTMRLILALCLVLNASQVHSQNTNDHIIGSWQGVLTAGAMEIRLIFNLSVNEDLALKATLDSPDQGTMGVPLGEVNLTEDSIKIDAPGLMGYYIGQLASETAIKGEWHQAGRTFILDLEKAEEAFVLNRPQEPHPPYPYKEEEVSFPSAELGFSLGGTLTLPEGQGPFPAAILVTGSGIQNRDEELFGHKPFKVIADHLTRKGVAVLRYDDRGVGSSGGNPAGSTTEDLASDARSAMNFLLKRSDIDHSNIGLIGHSEGGMIAFMLASSQKDLAYIVSLAGPGVDGKTILLEQSNHIARQSGVTDAILEDKWNVMNGVYEIMIDNESYDTWREKTLDFTSKFYSEKLAGNYSDEEIDRGKENLLASIPQPAYTWMRYFVMFDPAPLFNSITCSVLALNGEKDCQVIAEKNIKAIEERLLIPRPWR